MDRRKNNILNESDIPYDLGASLPQTNMFIEDISRKTIPIRTATIFEEDILDIDGENGEIFKQLFPIDHYQRHEEHIKVHVCRLIRNLSESILRNGRVVFETSDLESELLLHQLNPNYLFDFSLFYLLYNQKGKSKEKQGVISFFSKSNLFIIELPEKLGTVRSHKDLIGKLSNSEVFGNFTKRMLSKYPELFNLDPEKVKNLRSLRVHQLTQNFGWGKSEFTSETKNEMYGFYRRITEYWAGALLREQIVKNINLFLKMMDIDFNIKIMDLPSSQRTLEIREKMLNKELQFGQAIDQVRVW